MADLVPVLCVECGKQHRICPGHNKRGEPCGWQGPGPCGFHPAPADPVGVHGPGAGEYQAAARAVGADFILTAPPAVDTPPPVDQPPPPVDPQPAALSPDLFAGLLDGIGAAPPPSADGTAADLPANLDAPPPGSGPDPDAPGIETLAPVATRFVWQPRHVEWVLRGPVNRLHRRYNLDQLDGEEIRGGAEAIAPALTELWGRINPNSPYGALCLWVSVVYGTRLLPQLLPLVGIGRREAEPPPVGTPAEVPGEDGRGGGVSGWMGRAAGGRS